MTSMQTRLSQPLQSVFDVLEPLFCEYWSSIQAYTLFFWIQNVHSGAFKSWKELRAEKTTWTRESPRGSPVACKLYTGVSKDVQHNRTVHARQQFSKARLIYQCEVVTHWYFTHVHWNMPLGQTSFWHLER